MVNKVYKNRLPETMQPVPKMLSLITRLTGTYLLSRYYNPIRDSDRCNNHRSI